MSGYPSKLIEGVAEALANRIAMRKGCPPIKGCLALMPPEMADIFRDDATAALEASLIGELIEQLIESTRALEIVNDMLGKDYGGRSVRTDNVIANNRTALAKVTAQESGQ
jgi:hypothetical protein